MVGVGLDLTVHAVGKVCGVQQVGDLLGDAELDQIGVRADESLLVAAGGQLGNDVLDCAVAVVGNSVQYNTTCHRNSLLLLYRLLADDSHVLPLLYRYFFDSAI